MNTEEAAMIVQGQPMGAVFVCGVHVLRKARLGQGTIGWQRVNYEYDGPKSYLDRVIIATIRTTDGPWSFS